MKKGHEGSRELCSRECTPCRGGVEPLSAVMVQKYFEFMADGWGIFEGRKLFKVFKFRNFREALDFVNEVGELAEQQGHHPDIELSWGRVKVELWTHKIGGLHENDFILASKIDDIG